VNRFMPVVMCSPRRQGADVITPNHYIEAYPQPEVRVRLWRHEQRTTLCRIDGRFIADVLLGRSEDSRWVLEQLFATPLRILDLRNATSEGFDSETVREVARNLAKWDLDEEGRMTALLVETALGYGLSRMLQAHSSASGSKITVCKSLEEIEESFDMDLEWYKDL